MDSLKAVCPRCWVAATVLATVIAMAGCPRVQPAVPAGVATPPDPGPGAGESSAISVETELDSASLLYRPAPDLKVKPILRRLVDDGWDVGAKLDVKVKPIRSRYKNWRKIRCSEVRFTSHTWQDQPARIFGYYGRPARAGAKLPALLLIHGGGGYATLDRVIDAAARGYAALSIDLPGKGELREKHSRSTGPDMTVEQIFTVKPELTDNYIYNAVLAQMRSITFLRTRGEVDRERIGVVGVSWGGATGLITTSLDKRIKCFVNMFGSGFLRGGSTWHDYLDKLPAAEFDEWEQHFDAARYVADINVPVLGLTGTNDNCYYLPQFMRTLRAIKPTPQLLLRPNLDHRIDDAARDALYKWLAVHLKGYHSDGPPGLGALQTVPTDAGVRFYVNASGDVDVARAEISYGEVGDVGWTNREWKQVQCVLDESEDWWSAETPLPSPITYAFATVYFADGSALSTPVNSVAKVEINGAPVILQAPFMYTGALKAEAHRLAKTVGAQVSPGTDASSVTLVRKGWRAESEALAMGHLRFVSLRDVCRQLGGIVYWSEGRTIISLPSRTKP